MDQRTHKSRWTKMACSFCYKKVLQRFCGKQLKWRKRMSANQHQVGGSHYALKAIQPWDYIVGNNLGYLEGNVVKYVSRWRDKGGVDDLRKAAHYLEKLIEIELNKEK